MDQLDILLINTTASKKNYQELSKDFSAIEPPIWAGMLASHCLKHGFQAEILDCEALCLKDPQAAQQIIQERGPFALRQACKLSLDSGQR